MENDESKGFQVRDRRRFTESGDVREDAAVDRDESPADPAAKRLEADAGEAADAHEASRRFTAAAEARDREEGAPPQQITLATFLVSLSTQALMLLGEIPNPVTNQMETDLDGVREVIDLIGMVKEKTRGNLDPAEARLIDKILYDLRMRYVEQVRK
jgi:hypothetical protein